MMGRWILIGEFGYLYKKNWDKSIKKIKIKIEQSETDGSPPETSRLFSAELSIQSTVSDHFSATLHLKRVEPSLKNYLKRQFRFLKIVNRQSIQTVWCRFRFRLQTTGSICSCLTHIYWIQEETWVKLRDVWEHRKKEKWNMYNFLVERCSYGAADRDILLYSFVMAASAANTQLNA